jgi:DNA polymerase III subunit gamma/tau
MALALYRKYRPDSLNLVIGQDHVTEPLIRAITGNKVHHAYLFSGPRGCGKTSTARILARSLNCEKGPTPNPCGNCESCIDLSPGGNGRIDVVEIDAATHGGVDDARDLREQVIFVPIKDRFKIFIIDEAHQLSNAANNAMLKMIEEPPSHLKFIFATTEPEKMLGTIRSRTHNYAFRLVNKELLADHMYEICKKENIKTDKKALFAIANASGGSVRDALSLLGQFSAGVDEKGLSTEYVEWQLGLTPLGILDDLTNSIINKDLSSSLEIVRNSISQGIEPHRLLSDLLSHLGMKIRNSDDLIQESFGYLVNTALSISNSITQLKSSSNPELTLDLAISKLFINQHLIKTSQEKNLVTDLKVQEKKLETNKKIVKKSTTLITDIQEIEVRWSDILGELARANRVTWLIFMDSKPLEISQKSLIIGLKDSAKLIQANEIKWQEIFKKVLKDSLDLDLALEFKKIENDAHFDASIHDPRDETINEKNGIAVAIESLGAIKIDEFETEK